jgi:hypothetical protein
MMATKTLPSEYSSYVTLDLSKDYRLVILLNIFAIGLIFVFGWIFIQIARYFHPELGLITEIHANRIEILLWVILLTVIYIGILILHELIHGVFFWLITHERPRFGFKLIYAYAAAPGWYIPRNPFLVVGLAPLVLISLFGILLIPAAPPFLLVCLLFAMTMNASGAVGDIYVTGLLLTYPSSSFIQDRGDIFMIYRNGEK